MQVKMEIIKGYIADLICSGMQDFEIDADGITDTIALGLIGKIKDILWNRAYTDFEVVEEIVSLFQAHNIDCGERHDF